MKNLTAIFARNLKPFTALKRDVNERRRIPACSRWAAICALLFITAISATGAQSELKDVSISGGIENGKARLTIEGILSGLIGDQQKPAFATAIQESMQVDPTKITYKLLGSLDIVAGTPSELALAITGQGDIREVAGEQLQDWSIRQETNGARTLVLRLRKADKPPTQVSVTIDAY